LNCCFERCNPILTSRIPNDKGAAGRSRPHRFSRRLKRRPVVGSFLAARVVGALDAIELRDAVRFAFSNPALHTVLFETAAAELAFNLKMSALVRVRANSPSFDQMMIRCHLVDDSDSSLSFLQDVLVASDRTV
jgi:hypothetical protein